MRVIAGEFRGRKLNTPEGTTTRPTTDKVRLAVFNALHSIDAIEGAAVVDLFAGSGAIGIEALSRGAAQCTFVERDRDALRALRANIDALGLGERTTVIAGDVMAQLSSLKPAGVVFADPPYDFGAWPQLLALARADLVVAEAGGEVSAPDGWEVTRSRRYGRAWVTFLERVP